MTRLCPIQAVARINKRTLFLGRTALIAMSEQASHVIPGVTLAGQLFI